MRFRFRVFSLIVVGHILFFSLLWIPHLVHEVHRTFVGAWNLHVVSVSAAEGGCVDVSKVNSMAPLWWVSSGGPILRIPRHGWFRMRPGEIRRGEGLAPATVEELQCLHLEELLHGVGAFARDKLSQESQGHAVNRSPTAGGVTAGGVAHLQRWRSRSSDACTRGTIRRWGHWFCHQMAYWEVSSWSCWCSNVG